MTQLPLGPRSILLVAVTSLVVCYAFDRWRDAMPTALQNGPRA